MQGVSGIWRTQNTKVEGAIGIVTGNSIAWMAGYDEDVSLGLGSAGQKWMEETQIFEVVKDHQPGDLCLEQGSLDLAGNVMGGFVIDWQENGIWVVLPQNLPYIYRNYIVTNVVTYNYFLKSDNLCHALIWLMTMVLQIGMVCNLTW